MGKSRRSLTELARRVAEAQDQSKEARFDHERGRARLLEADLGVPGDRGARGLRLRAPATRIELVASLAAALLVAALAVVLVARPRAPIGFELGAVEAGVVGEWIAAPPSAELPIRFSDGSRLLLAPGGRARVVAVSAIGAEVALERGALDLAVVHRESTRWLVRVGPFQVHVIGTRFETSWDPVTEQLIVALREGAITVSGPIVGDARAVRAGERLTISIASQTIEVGSIGATTASAASSGAPSAALPAPARALALAPSALSPIAPSATVRAIDAEANPPKEQAGGGGSAALSPALREAPGWAALARDAKYKDALAAAEREGFDAICGAASARDLRALGDAARLGGSSTRAVQAFASLRRRFSGSPESAAAAFLLGRIAQDQSRDYAGAASWYARYLSEQPGGGFAAEAAGRLVEAEDRMGNLDGARRAAERYLAAYPSGAHAAYAQGVLARAASPTP